jgi:hypothetical protein
MDARTAAIAADAARIRAGHALALRVVRHKYAAQIAAHARRRTLRAQAPSAPRQDYARGRGDGWPRLGRTPRRRL